MKEIRLPLSKSIANRLLLIAAAGGWPDPLSEYSDDVLCDDLRLMRAALFRRRSSIVEVGDSGTAMRLLTAYFASLDGAGVELALSKRLSERPIYPLIDALRGLGADRIIKEGQSLILNGTTMRGGRTNIDASASSQFISALMLVAHSFEKGLDLRPQGEIVSAPYIGMTARLMRSCGAEVDISADFRRIAVAPGRYSAPSPSLLELDWSAAAFFYEYVALSGKPVNLVGLKPDSLQGDRRVAELFEGLGVQTLFHSEGALLKPIKRTADTFEADLRDTPDLYPALKVTLSLLKIPHVLTGLETLSLKESDREAAVAAGLRKMATEERGCIDTCNDHRIVMAFATARAAGYRLELNSVAAARKSFPSFPFL